jgi:membrane protease YdiL (CAAX protease family)
VQLEPQFVGGRLAATFGELFGQLFGNALYEEVLFRGVLLVQMVLWLAPSSGRVERRSLWAGLLGSQAVFALQHIPNRLAFGAWADAANAALDLTLLFVAGLFFAGVFLRTGNLLLVVGLHTLGNLPLQLVGAPSWWHPTLMASVMLTLIGFGPRLHRLGARES